MVAQRALHVACPDGGFDLVDLESPQFVGPVEYAWTFRNEHDPTVLGVGPLTAAGLPGAGGLVLATRSLLWDGFFSALLPGLGPEAATLGFSHIALRGVAPQPSVLVINRRGERVTVRVTPLDPEPLWRGTHDGEGVHALLHHVGHREAAEAATVVVLATGPAAPRSRLGSLCGGRWHRGQVQPTRAWVRRGGLGSRLYHVHRLCAVVLSSDVTSDGQPDVGDLLAPLQPRPSTAELESAARYEFSPRLVRAGEIGAAIGALGERWLAFNGRSIYLPLIERERFARRALQEHFLSRLLAPLEQPDAHHGCGDACPLDCRTIVGDRPRDLEPCVAMGPMLGVLDPVAMEPLATRADTLGLDSLGAGAAVAWLMERLERDLVEPQQLGVSGRPEWRPADFDPDASSQHNARLAHHLLDGLLFAPWGEPLRQGLRHAARAAGGASGALAIYNANGDAGETTPLPYWSPGYFAPAPAGAEQLGYLGLEFVPPRVLGRKCAHRLVAELALQNFGVCRLHRGWAEELVPDLVNRLQQTTVDWGTYHRDLAKRIFRRRKARFWETSRVIDIIATFVGDYQHNAAPDAELDRWVKRFREDRASAARAFWSEINAGLEEILGS